MTKAELLQLRLHAAAKEQHRTGSLLATLEAVPAALLRELIEQGWSDTDAMAAVLMILGRQSNRIAEIVLP